MKQLSYRCLMRITFLVAGGLQDPGSEVHPKAENVSLRMDKMNLLLLFYRIEPAHISG